MSLYRIGIEEEYFVTDLGTRNVRRSMSKQFFRECKDLLGDAVTSELLQSQIEALTPPCKSLAEARESLSRSRTMIASVAERHGLGIVSAGTHPLAIWPRQIATSTPRYDAVMADLQMLGRRNMLCGMHVHVEILDPDRRVEIMYRAIPFLPILLALSASSPFWRGQPTGLLGYRLAAYDELPRTGLPELFRTSDEYQSYVDTLADAGVIPTRAISGGRSGPPCGIRRSNCESPTPARVSTMRCASPRSSAASSGISPSIRGSTPISIPSRGRSPRKTSGAPSVMACT